MHEIVHALDRDPIRKAGGIGNLISDSTAWRAAWVAEIDCDDIPLTDYARESRREGFAEFGVLALTNPVLARRAFPKCWAVWREHCLDSDEMPCAGSAGRGDPAAEHVRRHPVNCSGGGRRCHGSIMLSQAAALAEKSAESVKLPAGQEKPLASLLFAAGHAACAAVGVTAAG